jgi:hypothetical protein
MQRVKAKAPAAYNAQVVDTEKRLNILFDHLNNEDLLKPDTVEQMQRLAGAIKARQHDVATGILTEIMTSKTDEGSNWMVRIQNTTSSPFCLAAARFANAYNCQVGVKRLIIMSKATPL